MEWSLCEAQQGDWRERGAVRRPVMVGRGGKCRSLYAMSCENENKSQSQRCAMLGNNH